MFNSSICLIYIVVVRYPGLPNRSTIMFSDSKLEGDLAVLVNVESLYHISKQLRNRLIVYR